jgi:hypothetical protein
MRDKEPRRARQEAAFSGFCIFERFSYLLEVFNEI